VVINEDEFGDFVYVEAIKNAVSFNGKANSKAIVGKCIANYPEMKKDMAYYINEINNICNQVNEISFNLQCEKLKELDPDFFENSKNKKKDGEKRDGLPNLEVNDGENVVVRFEPAPSGHLHLGHLFSIVANYEFKKKYGGKFILRFADTNPDNISLENYQRVIDDVSWICEGKIEEIVYQSDRIDIYYNYIRTLIELKEAYVCSCDSETFKAYTDASEECPHRKQGVDKNLELYEMMIRGDLKDGEAVIRAKADLNNKNPALRSFPLARLNSNKHVRVGNKYHLWPNMNLPVAIDDSLMNLTHVIRGKDHEIGELRQKMLHKALNLKSPKYFHTGRVNFVDMELSKSKLSEKIEKGEYESWSDPRVPSILSHRKRGYKAEAFRKFILSLGISKRDSKISSKEFYKGLDYFNKAIIERESDRLFFVFNPKIVRISNLDSIEEKEIILPKHPEDKSRGFRKFRVEDSYIIDKLDFQRFKVGEKIRLMHFGNFEVIDFKNEEMVLKFLSKNYDKNLDIKGNIHFLPSNSNKALVIMQDNSRLKGFIENLDNPNEETPFQFERFGFVKYEGMDKKDGAVFYFTHR
jgi:glutamyl-tRNA synthetase